MSGKHWALKVEQWTGRQVSPSWNLHLGRKSALDMNYTINYAIIVVTNDTKETNPGVMRVSTRRLWQLGRRGGKKGYQETISTRSDIWAKIRRSESVWSSVSETWNILTQLLIFSNSPLASQGISCLTWRPEKPPLTPTVFVSMLCSHNFLFIVPHFSSKLTDSCLAPLMDRHQPTKSSSVALPMSIWKC